MADPNKHHPTLLLLEMEDLLHAVRLHLARRRPSGTNPSPPPLLRNLDLFLHTLNNRFFIPYGSASS
jgi:hypothetical protein